MVLEEMMELVVDEDRSNHVLTNREGRSARTAETLRVIIYNNINDIVAEDQHRDANGQEDG